MKMNKNLKLNHPGVDWNLQGPHLAQGTCPPSMGTAFITGTEAPGGTCPWVCSNPTVVDRTCLNPGHAAVSWRPLGAPWKKEQGPLSLWQSPSGLRLRGPEPGTVLTPCVRGTTTSCCTRGNTPGEVKVPWDLNQGSSDAKARTRVFLFKIACVQRAVQCFVLNI